MIRMCMGQQNHLDSDLAVIRKLQHSRGIRSRIKSNPLAGLGIPNQERIDCHIAIGSVEGSKARQLSLVLRIPRLLSQRNKGFNGQFEDRCEFAHGWFVEVALHCQAQLIRVKATELAKVLLAQLQATLRLAEHIIKIVFQGNFHTHTLPVRTGKASSRTKHKIERAAFVLINEMGQAVVGGRSEVAAFDLKRLNEAAWRVRHEPPGRGLLRTVIAIAARTAAIYFRYGGVATAVFRAGGVAARAYPLRWSGLASRVALPSLTELASGAAREYAGSRFKLYGAATRAERARRILEQPRLPNISPGVSVDIEERLLDRLDPAVQLDRLARFLWRRQQLAVLRGEFMYFYTDLESGRGLAGVNLNNGRTGRVIKLNDPDYRLTTDEASGRLFVAKGNRLLAYLLTGG